MSFDEYIYTRFVRYFGKSRPDPAVLERTARLNELSPKLTVLARALTGQAVDIFPAEREGGMRGTDFFLPESIALLPSLQENITFYVFRVLYLSCQHKLGLNHPAGEEEDLATSRSKAIGTSQTVLDMIREEYPSGITLHDRLLSTLNSLNTGNEGLDLSWMYGKWMTEPEGGEVKDTIEAGRSGKKTGDPKPATTLKARAVESVKTLTVDQKMQEDYVMTHNFEKVETAEEFEGVWRDFDGSDELEDHQAALDELNMKYTVRSDEMTHSVYQAEFTENTSIAEAADANQEGQCVLYDEWDVRKGTYRPEFCKVFPHYPSATDPDYPTRVIAENASTLESLRKTLANVSNRRRQVRNMAQGEEFDLDMVTDMFVDIHNRHTPSEKIYLSARKREKDLSILLLLDNSLSTDSYAAGNRVIDVEKQVSVLFGEILHEYGIDFAICSFHSHTRNHTSFATIKDFNEHWSRGRQRIGAMEPHGYTRIGAAIRHSGAMLDRRDTADKWVILISDGKPNDYDKYEGRYGINDVRQALRELHERRIQSFAFAIEAQAKYYLPQMFGANHYQILTEPREMLPALVKFYQRIRQ